MTENFDIEEFLLQHEYLFDKMFKIFELKKKYAVKVLLNMEFKDGYLTFDRHPSGKLEINLRNKQFNGTAVCGVFSDEIGQSLEQFEINLKQFQDEFLKKKKEEEQNILNKGFTELEEVIIGYRKYPKINIIKSTGVIDWVTHQMIKCSWEKPIEKSTADKLLKLKKRDLILSGGGKDFICHKISKIELQTNKTTSGFNVCFGAIIEFKNGEVVNENRGKTK